jgi:O-antigen ligase
MILAIALFWSIYIVKDFSSKQKKSLAIAISVALLGIAYVTVEAVDRITAGNLSARTIDYEKEDITNGRETIYRVTWKMIKASTESQLVFGHGHNAVRRDSPLEISAHNEFLEIFYDYGIIALMLYLGLWFYVVKQFLFHFRNDTDYFLPYALSICIFAVMAMVSQLVVYVSYFLYLVMFWAVVQAAKEKEYDY